jgi:hypothetical protein
MGNPQQLRPGMVVLTESETARVVKYIAKCHGPVAALRELGLHKGTFDAARGYGRMMTTTRERVLEALSRVGA